MRTLIALLLLNTSAMAAWPANQALILTAPEGMECVPCERLQEHIKAEYEGVRVGRDSDAHFVVRHGSIKLGKFPQVFYYDAKGRLVHREIGYEYALYYNESLPARERKAALRKIVERHPEFIPDKPPMAPPVENTSWTRVVDLESPPESSLGTSLSRLDSTPAITRVQFSPYSDCGSQAFAAPSCAGGGGDFFTPPAQSYSVPFRAFPYQSADCGGGGGVGGGGDFFTPPAQSYGYAPQRYVVRSYVPRATMPQFANRGINNFSLINVQPQLSLGGLFGGRAMFDGQRTSRALGPRTYCGPSGCVMY